MREGKGEGEQTRRRRKEQKRGKKTLRQTTHPKGRLKERVPTPQQMRNRFLEVSQFELQDGSVEGLEQKVNTLVGTHDRAKRPLARER
jgi:hypothetical protein